MSDPTKPFQNVNEPVCASSGKRPRCDSIDFLEFGSKRQRQMTQYQIQVKLALEPLFKNQKCLARLIAQFVDANFATLEELQGIPFGHIQYLRFDGVSGYFTFMSPSQVTDLNRKGALYLCHFGRGRPGCWREVGVVSRTRIPTIEEAKATLVKRMVTIWSGVERVQHAEGTGFEIDYVNYS